MKRLKKPLALLLAVMMTIGVMNLPAKATETVNLSLGTGHTVDDTGQHRYVIQLTADKTFAAGNKQAVNVLLDDAPYTNPTNPLVYFYVFDATKGPSLVVYYDALEAAGGTKTAAQLEEHVITIPQGTTYQGFTVAEDLSIKLSAGEVTEEQSGNANDTTLTLGTGHTVDDTGQHRYVIQLTADKTFAAGNKQTVNVLLDDAPYTNPTNPLVYFYVFDATKGPSLVVYYDALEAAGGTKTAAQLEEHVITIPQGTTYQGFTVAADLSIKLSSGEVSEEADSNQNDIELSLGTGHTVDDTGQHRYVIQLASDKTFAAGDKQAANILLDGAPYTNPANPLIYFYVFDVAKGPSLVIYYDALESGGGSKTAADLQAHVITIPKGSTYQGYTITEDFTFSLVGGEVIPGELSKKTVTIQDSPLNANSTDTTGGFYFKVDPKDDLAYNGNWSVRYTATEGGVSVDEGAVRADVPLIKLEQDLYYVALSDKGITPVKGMQVTVDGTYGSGSATVKLMAATFVYHGDNKWTLGGTVEEDPYSEAPYQVLDLHELLAVPSVTITNDANYSLVDLGKTTNIAFQAAVKVEHTNASQDYTLAISKAVANNVWHDSGYQIKFYPETGRVRILAGADGTPVAEVLNADVQTGEFDLEYGVVDLLNKQSEVAARKVYVKVNGVEILKYQDDNLNRVLGTYVPAYAYSHSTAGMEVTIGSITHKGYEIVPLMPVVYDVSEFISGLDKLELKTNGVTSVGTVEKTENVAIKTKVVFNSEFNTYEAPRYDELKIAIGKMLSDGYWDDEKSGYELWIRPHKLYIGYEHTQIGASVEYDVPQEFTLEFGTYNLEIQKDGEKTGDYGKQVYVKIDGVEVLTWLDMDQDRVLGDEIITYASESVDADLVSLTSTKHLIRKANTVADIFDGTGLSEVKLNKDGLTKLGELPKESTIALRTKVKMNTDATELKFAISKANDMAFWDQAKSGWQFWLRPQAGRIYIGYGTNDIGAAVDYEFQEEFILEIGQRDVVYSTGGNYGREVYIKIDGVEVVSWIDTDYSRPLGKYLLAYTSDDADVTLTSLTTEGYVPVDKVAVPVDIFDVSQYAAMDLTPSTTMHLGDVEQFVGKSLKMKVNGNTDATEYKIGVAKTSTNNFWEPAGAGWQFWIRPQAGKVYIGYGVTEFAEFADYEFPENYELEVGARKVYFKNGKYMGVRLFINIDGEEVLSWIDTDTKRLLGTHVLAYASQDTDVTISTLYPTKNLPVSYLVNGTEQDSYELIDVVSTVVVGKDSRVSVEITKDQNKYVDYKTFQLSGAVQEAEAEKTDVFAGKYTYLLKAPKAEDKILIELKAYDLETDEARVFDFYDVAGVDAITVPSGEDMGVGNLIADGNPCGVNTAIQFVVDIPHKFNSIRISILSDNPTVWSVNGALLNIQKERVFLQNPANQATFAQAADKMFSENSSVYVEFGIVKCYADGIYRYDRSYVKAGKSLDSMELLAWYDNTERGAYGSGVICRGLDTEGVDYTLRSTKNLHKITDASEQPIDEVYYPKYVTHGSDASIKLYTEEGEKLQALTVAGNTVNTTVTADGAYVYEATKVSGDVKFAYTLTTDNSKYKVTAQMPEQLEAKIENEEVVAAGRTEVLIKAQKGYVLDTVDVNGSDYTELFRYDDTEKGWKATITGIREDKVIKATAKEQRYKVIVTGADEAKVTFGGDIKDNVIPAGGTLEFIIEPKGDFLIQTTMVNGKPIAAVGGVLTAEKVYSDTDEIAVEIQLREGEAVRVSGVLTSPITIAVSVVVLAGVAAAIVLLVNNKKKKGA